MALKSKTITRSLCVVIPAYNEEDGIEICVDQIRKYILPIKNTHLLVVNDGSTDHTAEILNKLSTKYKSKFSFISHKLNKGYGAALNSGAKHAYKLGYKYVLYMDSDLTNSPKDIIKFYRFINNNIDCVKASRFTQGGQMTDVPTLRKFFSIFGNLIARNCFRIGIKDCTNGFRMVKTDLIINIQLTERGFSSILEELYNLKKLNATFAEVPVILTNRKHSVTNFSYSWQTIISYASYAIKALLL